MNLFSKVCQKKMKIIPGTISSSSGIALVSTLATCSTVGNSEAESTAVVSSWMILSVSRTKIQQHCAYCEYARILVISTLFTAPIFRDRQGRWQLKQVRVRNLLRL